MTNPRISIFVAILALGLTACSDDLSMSECGDGSEECDESTDGTTADSTEETTDGCETDCAGPSCGDGVVDEGEECDDGGESEQCNADCTSAACGDGVLNMSAGESCDDGGESVVCNADCTPTGCGDGVTNASANEECDDMGESETCDADCTAAACGDGTINVTASETCDDMGESETCDDDCTEPACGDGVTNAAANEACDDMGESATCNADCTALACGDGQVNASAGEACDDGNAQDLDGCSANCQSDESCGNMYLDLTFGETCDDGNDMAGDGCSEACAAEPYQVCSTDIAIDIADNMTMMSVLDPPFPYVITDVDVAMDITHTSLDDLDIDVAHSDITVLIADNFDNQMGPGNACTGDDMLAILDDDASGALEGACVEPGPPAIDGRYRPEQSLSAFNDVDASGSWIVSITDNNEGEVGTLDRWCLNLNGFGAQPAQVYWANIDSGVWSVEADGANSLEVVSNLQSNFAIATDPANDHIYYDNNSTTITRADRDGANSADIITDASGAFGIAVDSSAGYLFWSDFNLDRVMRSDLDGDNQIQIGAANSPSGMAADPVHEKLYFITYNNTALYRVNYDGTDQEVIVPNMGGQGVGVAVDPAADLVYYSNRADTIFVAELDGANPDVLVNGQGAVQGIAIDTTQGLIYWVAPLAGMIRSANLTDGSNVQDLTTSNGNAWGMAFMSAP